DAGSELASPARPDEQRRRALLVPSEPAAALDQRAEPPATLRVAGVARLLVELGAPSVVLRNAAPRLVEQAEGGAGGALASRGGGRGLPALGSRRRRAARSGERHRDGEGGRTE